MLAVVHRRIKYSFLCSELVLVSL